MITTVTLNTSVDKLYLVDKLEDFTVMRVKEVHNTAGGKGLNVSRVAALLGEQVTALGFAGGFNGQYAEALLKKDGIESAFTTIQSETRSCINIRETSTSKHTELLEPGAMVTETEADQFLLEYQNRIEQADVITISGSVPQGIPIDFYAKLIDYAKQKQKPVLLDTSGKLLIEGIKAKPTLIKPNTDEIAQLFGRPVCSAEDVVQAALALQKDGIENVVVSLGKDGALAACKEGIFRCKTPDIPVVNTVGCGDSMIAGFAAAMRRKLPIEETIKLAMAVSTANALTMETGNFRQEDLETLLTQVQVKKL